MSEATRPTIDQLRDRASASISVGLAAHAFLSAVKHRTNSDDVKPEKEVFDFCEYAYSTIDPKEAEVVASGIRTIKDELLASSPVNQPASMADLRENLAGLAAVALVLHDIVGDGQLSEHDTRILASAVDVAGQTMTQLALALDGMQPGQPESSEAIGLQPAADC